MKHLFISLLGIFVPACLAAQTAQIFLKFPADTSNFYINLTSEKVGYNPSPAIGLTPVQYLNVGSFEVTTQRVATAEFELKEPQIVKIDITPKVQSIGYRTSNTASLGQLLYLSPNDKLTITINRDGSTTFEGSNAHCQVFLRDYFKANYYEYLPLFGYKPTKIDNSALLPKIDSLKSAREQALETLKNNHPASEAFNTLVVASTHTEAYLMKIIVTDKKIRESQGVQLKAAQRQAIESIVLQDFKLLGDDALRSPTYRSELPNYLLIPVTQKYPPVAANNYILSPNALLDVYQQSNEKLQTYPQQQEYVLTYWLNYAVTNQQDMAVARTLLEQYTKLYPSSTLVSYFKSTIASKEKMFAGQPAPDFTFKNAEGQAVSLKNLNGKPICVAFCFNLKQHEYNFKVLEESYRDRVTFVYLNITPNTPFDVWKTTLQPRQGVMNLWASEDQTEALSTTYVPTMQYPFVLIDAMGKIVQRWIPQEFPDNKTLQEELKNLLQK